ncbi:acyltransferase [Mycolicibacterium sp.]|uniref:acyltransferase family protein n=1 Tax=Mycolicibacterium sp. TaxID=2320850 RepID=UPI001A2CB213|nr:acyltransferase [Mycolicibacterium sp.]MBJ7339107.1 acyltransferase [Mycolicibacterium sp.]
MSEVAATELRAASPATIHSLTGIRAIAAGWVVIAHFGDQLYGLFPATRHIDWWIDNGYLGVEVFFVLSGFIISYNYADRLRNGASRYRDFLVNRFARLYPVHFVTLLATGALVAAAAVANVSLNSASRYTPQSFIGNLLMLQAAPGVPAWDAPAWSISAEALAYLTFPLTAWILSRLTSPRVAVAAAFAWLLTGTAAMMAMRLVTTETTAPGMALLRISTEFVAGAMLWKAWNSAGEPQGRKWDVLAGSAFALTVVGLATLPDWEALPLVLTPLIAVFVIACAGARGPIGWALSTRPMIYGGKISYSLYMTHFIVFEIVRKVLRWEAFADSSLPVRVSVMAFYYFACFVSAVACYKLVEEPGRRAIQRWAARRRAARSPARGG